MDTSTGMKVGALAAATGLTVRTLHYWESIGILAASHRSAAGHREYTEDDLARLYQIVALRAIGLDLTTIATCLAAAVDPHQVLTDHLNAVDAAIASMTALRERLQGIAAQLTAGTRPQPVTLVEAIRATRDANPERQALLAEHLNTEDLARLETAGMALGPAAHYLVEVEWPQLYRRAEVLRAAGTSSSDPTIRAVVQRMDQLSARFAGSDSGTPNRVRAAWRADPATMAGDPQAPADEWRALADYLDLVRDDMTDRVATTTDVDHQ